MAMRKDYGEIICQAQDGIALLTIDRPRKLNSITPEAFSGLSQALKDADGDKDTKVIIITGSGSRAFCGGFDVLNVPDLPTSEARSLHLRNLELNKQLIGTSKVTIAAVNGMALGAGFEISLLCDLTVAVSSATFGMPESAIGVYPGSLAPLLCQLLGHKRAKELLLTCRTVDATEAMALGMVNEVVAGDRLMDRAFELAKKIIDMAPLPVAMVKARMNSLLRVLLEDEMSRFVEAQTLLFSSSDFREGMSALREKRKPVFRGE
jgi:enoyl-CoA hydratase